MSHQAWVDGGWRRAHLRGRDDVIARPAGGHERGVWRHDGDRPGQWRLFLPSYLGNSTNRKREMIKKIKKKRIWIFFLIHYFQNISHLNSKIKCIHFGFYPLQPPSRNRRERAELRPDFFDSAAMIEDESVSQSDLRQYASSLKYVSICQASYGCWKSLESIEFWCGVFEIWQVLGFGIMCLKL